MKIDNNIIMFIVLVALMFLALMLRGTDLMIVDDEEAGAFGYINYTQTQSLTTPNVYHDIDVDFIIDFGSNFIGVNNSKIRYIGNETDTFIVSFEASIKSNNNNAEIHIADKKNGVYIVGSESGSYFKSAGEENAIGGFFVFELKQGDEINFIISSDKTNDIISFIHFQATITKFY